MLVLTVSRPPCFLYPMVQYMQIHPLTEEGIAASKAKLAALRAADEVRRQTAQAKNDLESYILKVGRLYGWVISDSGLL